MLVRRVEFRLTACRLQVLTSFPDEFQDFSLFQWMGETPRRLVQDHLFQHDPKSGEKFAKVVESAEKDVIKSQYEKSPGMAGEKEYL